MKNLVVISGISLLCILTVVLFIVLGLFVDFKVIMVLVWLTTILIIGSCLWAVISKVDELVYDKDFDTLYKKDSIAELEQKLERIREDVDSLKGLDLQNWRRDLSDLEYEFCNKLERLELDFCNKLEHLEHAYTQDANNIYSRISDLEKDYIRQCDDLKRDLNNLSNRFMDYDEED